MSVSYQMRVGIVSCLLALSACESREDKLSRRLEQVIADSGKRMDDSLAVWRIRLDTARRASLPRPVGP